MKLSRIGIVLILPVSFLFFSCALFPSHHRERLPNQEEIRQACSMKPDLREFGDEFSAVLSRLLTETWKENGDWHGDVQGDATFFAPVVLYALWKDTGNPAFRAMADRTVEHEISLVRRFYLFPVPGMDMVIGFPVLAESYKATGDKDCLVRYLSGVRKGSALASFYPGFFTPFVYDKASVYGTVGTMTFQAYELTRDDSFKRRGITLVKAADQACWSEKDGLYAYDALADWPQATMMIALVAAYRATGDMAYLDRCRRITSSLDERFLDKEKGGYFGHLSATTKGLSGNNALAWAFLDLHEATGDRAYLDRTRSVLKWIFSDDLYNRKSGIIYHHWNKDDGRSERTCTGCNFHTLCIIYRLNKLER